MNKIIYEDLMLTTHASTNAQQPEI